MNADVAVIVLGLAILAILAILVGKTVDRQARDEAWRRIAAERRRNSERRRDLDDTRPPCSNPDCPLRGTDEPPPPDDSPR